MTGGHDHGTAHAGAEHRGRLLVAFGLIAVFFVVELVGGLLTNSLALLSDAGHMFTDVLGLGMALAAIQAAASSERGGQRTFGLYRLEILAALANAALLFGVALLILWEAVNRLGDPPDVLGTEMLVVASLGLVVNLVVFWLLREGASESLNVEGAYLEVLADTLGSVAVVVAAVVIEVTGWTIVDPVFGVGVGLFVLPRTWRLGRRALRILIQAAPEHLDVEAIEADLAALAAVEEVHDLHVWTLTSGMEVATVHLRLARGVDGPTHHDVLDRARHVLRDEHGLAHATIQVEPDAHDLCEGSEEAAW